MASEPLEQSTDVTRAVSWLDANRYRLLKFAGVGLSGVVVNLVVFTVAFHQLLGVFLAGDPKFVAANACGFVVSVFTNFLLNDCWTWGDRRKGDHRHWFRRLAKYYATASGAGAIQLFSAWLSLTVLWAPLAPTAFGHELAPTLGVLTGIGCGMIINFTVSHLWAFRDAPAPKPH